MKELHALVDYENAQPTLAELAKLAPEFTDVWLFHGPHQVKQAQHLADAHSRVTLVLNSGKSKNALDFHLSFYLGYVAAKHPLAELVVVADDKGYDPMIVHARSLGFTVQRIGFKARNAPAVKKAPVAKPAAPAKKPAAVKKAVPAVKRAPVKQATPTKTPTPAKKASAKKTPVKKAPAKKVPAKKAAPSKAPAQPKVAAATESKEFTRVKKALSRMGAERPHKLKSFLRHVQSMLGKDSTAVEIEAVVKKLEEANIVHITGDLVLYS